MKMNKLTKIILVLFVISLAVSALNVIFWFDHECEGEHCVYCDMNVVCGNNLKQISVAMIFLTVAIVITFALNITCSGLRLEDFLPLNLVALKVKLSN